MALFSESYLKDNVTLLTEKSQGLDISSFFSDIKADFKKSNAKQEKEKIETKATRFIFAKRPNEIITGFPSIMSFTRTMLCLGATVITPFVGIPLLLVNAVISEKATEKDIDKYIDKIKEEITEVRKEIEKAETKEIKDNLELLLKKYEDGQEKLEKHKEKILKYHNRHDLKEKEKEDDDFGDFGFDFDEAAIQTVYDAIKNETNMDIPMEFVEMYLFIEQAEVLQEKAHNRVFRKIQQADKKVSGTLDRNVEQTIGTLKRAVTSHDREDLIKGSLPRASRIIKTAIFSGSLVMVNPALAVITALVSLALSAKIKDSEKTKILAELKEELRITEEKIKDADGRGENKKKYQLMRIQSKLNRDIERIRKGR